MRKPSFGEASVGAVVGAVVGAIGGLFAVGIAPAIIERSMFELFRTPILVFICWLISTPAGWFIGGQLGPRLADRLSSPKAEIVGGALGGLVPVTLIGLWAWWMVTN
jgi:hypothetical protein